MARKSKYTFRPDCEGLEGRQLMSTINNVFSGKVLDDSEYSTSNGTHDHPVSPERRDQSAVECSVPLSNGNYAIQNAYSGKVLDNSGYSTSNGTAIIQYDWNGGTNQQWNLVPLGAGKYEIQNVFSGKVLDDPGYSTSDGTGIIQYDWNGGTNQQWTLS